MERHAEVHGQRPFPDVISAHQLAIFWGRRSFTFQFSDPGPLPDFGPKGVNTGYRATATGCIRVVIRRLEAK